MLDRINTLRCDVLKRSVYSSSAGEYHKKFLAFSLICNTILSPSSSVLRKTELAEWLRLPNKVAFSRHKSFYDSNNYTLFGEVFLTPPSLHYFIT